MVALDADSDGWVVNVQLSQKRPGGKGKRKTEADFIYVIIRGSYTLTVCLVTILNYYSIVQFRGTMKVSRGQTPQLAANDSIDNLSGHAFPKNQKLLKGRHQRVIHQSTFRPVNREGYAIVDKRHKVYQRTMHKSSNI